MIAQREKTTEVNTKAKMNGMIAVFSASHILCQDTFSSLVITKHPLDCV